MTTPTQPRIIRSGFGQLVPNPLAHPRPISKHATARADKKRPRRRNRKG